MVNKHFKKGSEQVKFPNDGKLRLYSMRFCPFAQRAHLVLNAKGIPYNTAYIDLDDKPEWLVNVSPLLKVPALEVPGENGTIIESLVVADYIDEKYPQNQLHSKDPFQKARDRMLIERFNEFIEPFYKIVFTYKMNGAPGAVDQILRTLDIFEEELKNRNSKFFGGSKPGMLDYMIWPWYERIDMFQYILGKFELDKQRFSELLKWIDEMMMDKAVVDHFVAGKNHFKFFSLKLAKTPDYDFLF